MANLNRIGYLVSAIEKPPKSECIEWPFAKNDMGYGQLSVGRKVVYAHRTAWSMWNGRTIPKGICVLHRCDNPACFNPHHLFIGTKADNTNDMVSKGRHRCLYGVENPRSKLTPDDVRMIRVDARPLRKIAAEYGLAQRTIAQVKHRITWKDVV